MMKRIVQIAMIGMVASVADAATIGLRWADTAGPNHDGPGVIEVWIRLLEGDSVSAVTFNYAASDTAIVATSQTAVPSGWQQTGNLSDGVLSNVEFAAAADPGHVIGPDWDQFLEVVVGTTHVAIVGPLDGTTSTVAALIPQSSIAARKGDGNRFSWDARYNQSSIGYIAFGYGYPGYGSPGYGNPGWGTKTFRGHQPTPNPLLITRTPEPTGLALVALGGFALLRRRR